jgi:hypothetical protein
MTLTDFKASFKNSRISPRSATTTADTGPRTVTPVASIIVVANSTRTYLALKNEGPDTIRYGYDNSPTLATDGIPIPKSVAVEIESPGAIWAIATGLVDCTVYIDEGSG